MCMEKERAMIPPIPMSASMAATGIQIENTHVIVKESLSHARNAKAGFTIKNAKPCFFSRHRME